jgi:hypothetical protein
LPGTPCGLVRGSSFLLLLVMLVGLAGCVVVPQNRRRYLADPTMQAEDSELEARARRKQHTSREGAGGGDGEPAGGGCGCGN